MLRGLCALAVFVGLIWIGQGLGWIGGSFMTGDLLWTWIGLAVVAVGGGVLVTTRKKE
jgi:LPXTG-motif cell wall-anchored protein